VKSFENDNFYILLKSQVAGNSIIYREMEHVSQVGTREIKAGSRKGHPLNRDVARGRAGLKHMWYIRFFTRILNQFWRRW